MNKVMPLRLAIAGVGNNISALVQGVEFYRRLSQNGVQADEMPGVAKPEIGEISVWDIEFVCAFDVDKQKVGIPISRAAIDYPNNYPLIVDTVAECEPLVVPGLTRSDAGDTINRAAVIEVLRASGAEVLLYSLPSGLQWEAEQYARCALSAGVGFVNCTPEVIARDTALCSEFERRALPMVGDDLASHFGSSVLHREVLALLARRGLNLVSSYQINLGGNQDFRNLRQNAGSKERSKKNALAGRIQSLADKVEVIPSGGYIAHLNDHKVAYMNIEAVGWGGTPISVDLKLSVQDSSNAAGVIIDLIRYAGCSKRDGRGGFPKEASALLKSPPGSNR